MNAMESMAKAEMMRVKRVWATGGNAYRTSGNYPGKTLEQKVKARAATKEKVQSAIKLASEIHRVPVEEIMGRSRMAAIAEARQAAMLFAREAEVSLTEIGHHMDRHHSTILHGIAAAESRIKENRIVFDGWTFKTTRKG